MRHADTSRPAHHDCLRKTHHWLADSIFARPEATDHTADSAQDEQH